eukprot:936494_1
MVVLASSFLFITVSTYDFVQEKQAAKRQMKTSKKKVTMPRKKFVTFMLLAMIIHAAAAREAHNAEVLDLSCKFTPKSTIKCAWTNEFKRRDGVKYFVNLYDDFKISSKEFPTPVYEKITTGNTFITNSKFSTDKEYTALAWASIGYEDVRQYTHVDVQPLRAPVTCDMNNVPTITAANIIVPEQSTLRYVSRRAFGGKIVVNCKRGYMIGNQRQRRTDQTLSCSSAGDWSSLADCFPMKCYILTLRGAAGPFRANAHIVNQPEATFGLTADLRCNANHAVSGTISDDPVLKTKTGDISLSAECVLKPGKSYPEWKLSNTCELLTCAYPPTIENAVLDPGSVSTTIGYYGRRGYAAYTCSSPHYVFRETTDTRLSNFQSLRCAVESGPNGNTRVTKWSPSVPCVNDATQDSPTSEDPTDMVSKIGDSINTKVIDETEPANSDLTNDDSDIAASSDSKLGDTISSEVIHEPAKSDLHLKTEDSEIKASSDSKIDDSINTEVIDETEPAKSDLKTEDSKIKASSDSKLGDTISSEVIHEPAKSDLHLKTEDSEIKASSDSKIDDSINTEVIDETEPAKSDLKTEDSKIKASSESSWKLGHKIGVGAACFVFVAAICAFIAWCVFKQNGDGGDSENDIEL